MSREVMVICDEPGCGARETTAPRVGRSVAQQRRRREKMGWLRIEGYDFCPEHSDFVAIDPESDYAEEDQ